MMEHVGSPLSFRVEGSKLEWLEIGVGLAALSLLICALTPKLRTYRSLLLGAAVLMAMTMLAPRHGNRLGQFLFDDTLGSMHLPRQLLGITWWILGAWLCRSSLTLILRKTIFPNDYLPHSRRLFADLASGMVYIIAFVGIMDTVVKEPISAFLATSGVLAIVLGLALQNTLADVFSGIAISIESCFGPGDWITLNDDVEGEIIEVNWRATRIRTVANDMVVIPNSVIAKAMVRSHRRLNQPYVSSIALKIDSAIASAHIIKLLESAASAAPGIATGHKPTGYACGFDDAQVSYRLYFGVESFELTADVLSQVIIRVTDALRREAIPIGAPPSIVKIGANRSAKATA